ncbi:conserved dual specificity protein phosphatase [Tokyovirus A1]|uniref:conserved dual specificity protein phosphatase n=1 Tax=Tokyovirus A1 TaxID=1826170 RepID=UPI0007A98610|nr:conserved dual specificity protein phosphatase [Tokyovirus A1]BAU80034.1 conserved dual specificity protein phosphatase [Tokyovirus A1]
MNYPTTATYNHITERLYLGNLASFLLLSSSSVEEQKKWAVVTILSKEELCEYDRKVAFPRFIIKAMDSSRTNIKPVFRSAASFIQESLAAGLDVLVHCAAGISRSSSVVIAFLMLKRGMTYDTALAFVKSKRKCVDPNPGFRFQLEELNREIYPTAGF